MSDFLSNFTNNQYDGKKREETVPVEELNEEPKEQPKQPSEPTPPSRFDKEETEFDPEYKQRQVKKYSLIGLAVLAALAILGVIYYQITHVKVPDFKQETLADARSWGTENNVPIKVEQAHNFDVEVNGIVDQSVPKGQKIKKGRTLTVTTSLGPDPEEVLTLPTFKELSFKQAQAWVTDNKAENVVLTEQYDEKVPTGEYLKEEKGSKELDLQKYRRKDRLMVYYSKGKETFEKTIDVPDFTNKPQTDVEEWAKKNEIKLTLEQAFSPKVAVDMVVSQNVSPSEKIAKHDALTVKISKGKALVVPDYSQYTIEQAEGLQSQVNAVIKSMYSDEIPYGTFISQSVEAGKELDANDTTATVKVIYSEGRPYLKDLRGAATEGELPKLFFETYRAKGANITYTTYGVSSSEPKGTVVEMSQYGEFIPLETTIQIGISLGDLSGGASSMGTPPPIIEKEKARE